MTKFWSKIKGWFQPKSRPKNRLAQPRKNQLIKSKKPADNYQPINHQHYRKFIGKIAKQAIAVQRARQRRNHE